MMHAVRRLFLFIALLSLVVVDGFVQISLSNGMFNAPPPPPPPVECRRQGNNNEIVSLHQSADNNDVSGTGRGIPLLIAALLFSAWFFTIPPEFRRTHVCSSTRCVEDHTRPYCYNCKTVNELKDGILEYYRNGGGIQWDFSIDPDPPTI
eukprot:CAMPEP_0116837962 /NCGR_PEP_ID=MMETSP0418-20121206/8947_1 /TAXON_ID=1158023 /ORGANISM="Astrosyne radiata, Strain 13vi08-1A" /LENGTH=149 /DNA_ID=CAMNT_0004467909 /DNA_START=107 /DNA_END=557 /DNA_ORIENTATION=+